MAERRITDTWVDEYSGKDHRVLGFTVQPPVRPSQVGYIQAAIARQVEELGSDVPETLPERERGTFNGMIDDFNTTVLPLSDATEIRFKFFGISRYDLTNAGAAQAVFHSIVEQAVMAHAEHEVCG